MKIAFIGDIVGRPGRTMLNTHLKKLKKLHEIDFVIANYENASHGFGLSTKNANELFNAGIDVMTGGNHTWDKKDIKTLLTTHNILRPLNYPDMVVGEGCKTFEVNGLPIAVINAMGHFSMPYVDNVFRSVEAKVDELIALNVKHIFIDMHAEATSEKRALFLYLKEKISALIGTHTHVGTDDLQIIEGTAYASDVGMTGCRDNVIGMNADVPIERFITGVSPGRFEVPEKCKAWMQMMVMDLDDEGRCTNMYKIRRFCDGRDDTRLDAYID